MNKNQTESKPPSVEEPREEGLLAWADQPLNAPSVRRGSRNIFQKKGEDILLHFSDGSGKLHEVTLSDILNNGVPIDPESGEDMEHAATFILE